MVKKQQQPDQSKLVAILSYITLIGWIVALILNQSKKTELGSFHIRQALLIMIAGIILMWIPIIGWLLNIVVFVFWIMGLVYAIQGQMKEVPVLGPWAQQWFKGL
ncbi:hypothetical protein KY332_02945 [Candidatus Woesearchaeota archaeon]|nr:hypothetical protein [Candidatus Woesearchaeota archaeon]